MTDIYSNPGLYDALHKDIKTDKSVITHFAKQCNGPVLEIASGTGRLAEYIIELGLPYTGIDNSRSFVKTAINNLGQKGKFLLHDMRNFSLGKSYDFAFIGFNSFLHNLNDNDALNCLKSINKHLSNEGLFLLSIFQPDPLFLYQDEFFHEARSFFDYNGKKCRMMEKNSYDDVTQINNLSWHLETEGILSEDTYSFQQRMYYPHKMDILFDQAGLIVQEKFGDWNMTPLREESPLQIYICRLNKS